MCAQRVGDISSLFALPGSIAIRVQDTILAKLPIHPYQMHLHLVLMAWVRELRTGIKLSFVLSMSAATDALCEHYENRLKVILHRVERTATYGQIACTA